MKRLAIITSHPVQYNAPLFALLHAHGKISINVFYTWEQSQSGIKYDPGFAEKIEWDIPLLDDYPYCFVKNNAKDPGTHHFTGIINPELIPEIEKWNPDAILVYGWNFHSHLKCLRYFHNKITVLFRGDSTMMRKQGMLKQTLRILFLKWIYQNVDFALYVGTNNKSYFLKSGMKEKQLIFVPHAIDNTRFYDPSGALKQRAEAWKHDLGIARDERVILFAGKFEAVKNVKGLITSFMKNTNAKLKLILTGSGPLEQELRLMALPDKRILFLPFQNQSLMPVVYRLADIFILPSFSETWGLAVNEAMACAKPVIVSKNCGCCINLVEINQNGFTFDPGNGASLDRVLSQVEALHGKDLVLMGLRSLELIQDYSIPAQAKAIENLFIA